MIEFRASIVIGSGSLSFEMIRALVERLPIMICPRWIHVKAQPIAIEDLLEYLMAAMELPTMGSQVFEIGGPDQVSYREIMQEYAQQRGLTRWMVRGCSRFLACRVVRARTPASVASRDESSRPRMARI